MCSHSPVLFIFFDVAVRSRHSEAFDVRADFLAAQVDRTVEE
ncbi:MAG TPA: hypothetical protein VGO18_00585 [Steroidobacteraceae bacterium]|jgi:hypothetical protein|nr:hypothetical protein [Steroidobacteraceae bacterium]